MLLYFLGTTLLVYLLSLGYISYKIKTISTDTARHYLKINTGTIVERVKGLIEEPLIAVTTIASNFDNYQVIEEKDRRMMFTKILEKEINSNKNYLSIWSIWEPYSIDKLDVENILQPTSTTTGNFAPSFYRDGEIIKAEINTGNPPFTSDFYTIPKETRKQTILKPYYYSYSQNKADSVFIISVVTPILDNGEFKGVVGIDFFPTKLTRFFIEDQAIQIRISLSDVK